MSHGHRQTEINKPEDNVHWPASYIADQPALYLSASLAPIGSPQTMRSSCGWWPRERHTACDFPCCFQFYTQRWWEMNLPWLSLKGSAKQRSIKKSMICCRASVRHIHQRYNTAASALRGREYVVSAVDVKQWSGKQKYDNIASYIVKSCQKLHVLKRSIHWLLIMSMVTQGREIVSLYCY